MSHLQDLGNILIEYAIEAGIAVISFIAGLLSRKRPKKKDKL